MSPRARTTHPWDGARKRPSTASPADEVAPGVHRVVLGRAPMASNAYLVRGDAGWVLVDAGWSDSAAHLRSAVAVVCGSERPAAILLTHIHPDHSGAVAELARSWCVPVFVHSEEIPAAGGRYLPDRGMPLDRWAVVPVMRLLPASVRRRVEEAGNISELVRPLDPEGRVPRLPGWTWVPTPGHTPGHVVYLREDDGVLISGDAVLTVDLNSVRGIISDRPRLSGPPWYTTWSRVRAVESIGALAGLEPRVLAPGHGRPWRSGTATALRRLAADPATRGLWGWLQPRYVGAAAYRRPPRWYTRAQVVGHALTRLGLSPAYVVTLNVPGRRSGELRRTNLVLCEHQGGRYLVALAGESEWARNVRAARGRVVLTRRGRPLRATLVEVPVEERAPVLRAYLVRAGRDESSLAVTREAENVFGVQDVTRLADVAHRHPTFRVTAGWRSAT